MRVLLVNPVSEPAFWSFDTILSRVGKKALSPPLGLLTVASLLPEEWEVRLADLDVQEISEKDWDDCDLLMVTGMVTQHIGMVETIREGKNRGKTVIAGGPLCFHFPEHGLRAGAAIVVKGEAEGAMPLLLQAINRHESGIVIEPTGKPDLKDSPPPRFDLLDMKLYVDMAVQFSRGCPFHCEFCDITLMLGRHFRTKSPEQILGELQILYDMGWRRNIGFVDDNFIGNPSAAKDLLRLMIPWMEERRYPFNFNTQASVNVADDPELLDLMVRAGFYRVFLGIETTDRTSLEISRKRQNLALDMDQACRKITRAGLIITASCIMGFDNEQPGADMRLIDFANRNHVPEMFVTLLQAGPGTDMWKRLEKEGRLKWKGYGDGYATQTGLPNFTTTRPVHQIVREFVRVFESLYAPNSYLLRTFNSFARMKPLPVKKKSLLPTPWEIHAVIMTLIAHGVLYTGRSQFWKLLLLACLKFPDRLRHFLACCVAGEHYYRCRLIIREKLEDRLSKM